MKSFDIELIRSDGTLEDLSCKFECMPAKDEEAAKQKALGMMAQPEKWCVFEASETDPVYCVDFGDEND